MRIEALPRKPVPYRVEVEGPDGRVRLLRVRAMSPTGAELEAQEELLRRGEPYVRVTVVHGPGVCGCIREDEEEHE